MRHVKLGAAVAAVLTVVTGATVAALTVEVSPGQHSAAFALDSPPEAHGDPDSRQPARPGREQGCPSGAVCVYPGKGFNGGHPSLVLFSFGAHNLTNQFGVHRVFNNQFDGAVARTCTARNGGGCLGNLDSHFFIDPDLSPIDSIVLAPR